MTEQKNIHGGRRMRYIVGIDPGNEYSAFVLMSLPDGEIRSSGKVVNDVMRVTLRALEFDCAYVEAIASYGMPVGRTVFDTCEWIGRFKQIMDDMDKKYVDVPRREVKLHLCNSSRAKDTNIRHAIIDRYGGKEKAIGKKKTPGPLYGFKADMWSALAICLLARDTCEK